MWFFPNNVITVKTFAASGVVVYKETFAWKDNIEELRTRLFGRGFARVERKSGVWKKTKGNNNEAKEAEAVDNR